MKVCTFFFILCSFFIQSAFCYDWSTVTTVDELANVDPNEFKTIKAEDISQIAQRGLCGGFNSDQIQNCAADGFKGFNDQCIEALKSEIFAHISASQIKNWNTVCSAIGDKIKNLPSLSYAGLTKLCVKSLAKDSCSSFAEDILEFLTPDSFSGFSNDCISAMDSIIFEKATANQISNLESTSCSIFSAAQMHRLSENGYSGLTKECVNALAHQNTSDACGAITSVGIAAMSGDAISGLNSACVALLSNGVFSDISAVSVSHLTDPACGAMKVQHTAKMNNEGYGGFSKSCFEAMTTVQTGACAGLKGSGMRYITNEALSGVSPKCMNIAPADVMSEMSPALLSSITEGTCASIRANQLLQVPGPMFGKFSDECVESLDSSNAASACSVISGDQISSLSKEKISHIKVECLFQMSSDAVTELTADQFSGLGRSCDALNSSKLPFIPPEAFKGMTDECMTHLSPAGCTVMREAFLKNMPNRVFGSMQSLCLKLLPSRASMAITSDQALELNEALAGITSPQLHRFCTLDGFVENMTAEQVSHIPGPAFWGLEKDLECDRLADVKLTGTELKSSTNLEVFFGDSDIVTDVKNTDAFGANKEAMLGLNKKQSSKLPKTFFTSITTEDSKYIGPGLLAGMTKEDLFEIDPNVFAVWAGYDIIRFLPVSLVPFISSAQLQALSLDQCRSFCKQQGKAFSQAQIDSFVIHECKDAILNIREGPDNCETTEDCTYSSSSSASSSSPSSSKSPGGGNGHFFVYVLLVLVISALSVVGALRYKVHRTKKRSHYQPLDDIGGLV
eukprot:TRINITY_DN4582_c0_g1_i1.p1 TRINITY_DN4582_c0_g1~~TRINITY_DN4582_c0_g1_i1.p1  ORF type:complete len:794 (+),score=196.62 TRINITY_DN4582_c0_g1_i1:70-2451(+)